MLRILLVTNERSRFSSLVQGLKAGFDGSIEWADSVEEARKKAIGTSVDVMILDEKIDGGTNLDIAHRMVLTNPTIHLVLVSPLNHEDFHEASEGLGILAQLPRHCGKEDAEQLLEAIRGQVSV